MLTGYLRIECRQLIYPNLSTAHPDPYTITFFLYLS